MTATTDVTTLADCPACKKPITARLTYEVKIDPPVVEQGVPSGPDRLVAATLTAVGVHVQHDCTPRATGYALGGLVPKLPTGDAPMHA